VGLLLTRSDIPEQGHPGAGTALSADSPELGHPRAGMISAAETAPGEAEEAFLGALSKCPIPGSPGAGSGASSRVLPTRLSWAQPWHWARVPTGEGRLLAWLAAGHCRLSEAMPRAMAKSPKARSPAAELGG